MGGSGVTLGAKRIVLLLGDMSDVDGFELPQAWVDIPAWAVDYYLAIQIDPENQ
ncbi:hypothetical protein N836_12990 [Leptolyngbya sp. Heron Island J]|nr:hypothetical protein N836_12990 [Leptolyngbya sp. Heron Island J]